MDEQTAAATTDEQQQAAGQAVPNDTEQAAATDWKSAARKWEERSKANKARVDELSAKLEEQSAAAADLAAARERAERAEHELEEMRAANERAALVAKVADAHGVPAALIHGDSAEELEQSAAALERYVASQRPGYPSDKGAAATASPTLDYIESIKDPVARVRARAEHIDLYK